MESSSTRFKFLTDEEAQEKGDQWFPVQDIWDIKEEALKKRIGTLAHHKDSKEFLETLYKRIHEEELINYFQTEERDLGQVCNIFVRMNTGGINLSNGQVLPQHELHPQWKGNAKEEYY